IRHGRAVGSSRSSAFIDCSFMGGEEGRVLRVGPLSVLPVQSRRTGSPVGSTLNGNSCEISRVVTFVTRMRTAQFLLAVALQAGYKHATEDSHASRRIRRPLSVPEPHAWRRKPL